MTLAEKIFTLRRKNGLSQDDLANELGVSRQAVYKWESGNSTPEIDKIKMLSKLFKVSFDYLLNDDIDDFEPSDDTAAKSERAQVSYRTVFCANEKHDPKQASTDHGFIGIKSDVEMAEPYFHRRMTAANKALDEAGVGERVFFKPTETTAWFYDESRKAIGFYYAGKIQLICPVENILGFNLYGGGQAAFSTQNLSLGLGVSGGALFGGGIGVGRSKDVSIVEKSTSGVLTYYDAGSVKEFEITLNPNDDYMIETVAIKRGEDFMNILYTRNRTAIEQNFDKLKQKIETLKMVAMADEREVDDIDTEFFAELNKKYGEDYANFKNRILNPQAYLNQKRAQMNNDPNRIKLDQTVPKKERSDEDTMRKALKIMGIIGAVLLAMLFFYLGSK